MVGDIIYCINKQVARSDVEGIILVSVTSNKAPYLYVYLELKDDSVVNYFNCIGALNGKGYDLRQDNIDRLYEEFKDLKRKTFISAEVDSEEDTVKITTQKVFTDENGTKEHEENEEFEINYSYIVEYIRSNDAIKRVLWYDIWSLNKDIVRAMFPDEDIYDAVVKALYGVSVNIAFGQ